MTELDYFNLQYHPAEEAKKTSVSLNVLTGEIVEGEPGFATKQDMDLIVNEINLYSQDITDCLGPQFSNRITAAVVTSRMAAELGEFFDAMYAVDDMFDYIEELI